MRTKELLVTRCQAGSTATTTWKEFIKTHMDVLAATDFSEVWTKSVQVTYCVLFFMHVGTRKVYVARLTPHLNEAWVTQIARNVTTADAGFLSTHGCLIHDRDGRFCRAFVETVESVGVKSVKRDHHQGERPQPGERERDSVPELTGERLLSR